MPPNAAPSRPGRSLLALLAVILALAALAFFTAPSSAKTVADKFTPRLGLDLEGGTSVILTPRAQQGGQRVTSDALSQAVEIIRLRVDSFGVSEAEVTTSGNNIIISVPGSQDSNILETVRQTAELRFRVVEQILDPLPASAATPSPGASGSPPPSPGATATPGPSATASVNPGASPSGSAPASRRVVPKALAAAGTSPSPSATPSPSPSPTGAGAAAASIQQQIAELDCTNPESVRAHLKKYGDDPNKQLVACDRDGSAKFVLTKAELVGTDVSGAAASLRTNQQGAPTGGWKVDLNFTGSGSRKFADVTQKLAQAGPPQNQFAIVLDGSVVSAPSVQERIAGSAEITGDFTQKEAQDLANVLKYGALPLAFDPGQVQRISPTLGSDYLRAGLVAGAIGMGITILYLLAYYRGLGLIAVASLVVAALVTLLAVVWLGNQIGFRLSLAGVAGLIVAIGITADSFIVYFERLRDEVRDGKSLRVAVESGWRRAWRTILTADAISLLAAVVLYVLAVGGVKGFAFTLGLTTLVDVLLVALFTKPLVTIASRGKFFAGGHRLSGLAPERLGSARRSPSEALVRRRPAQTPKEA